LYKFLDKLRIILYLNEAERLLIPGWFDNTLELRADLDKETT
jgi:hypothetical protein